MSTLSPADKAFISAARKRAYNEFVMPLQSQGLDGFSIGSITKRISKSVKKIGKTAKKLGIPTSTKGVIKTVSKAAVGPMNLMNMTTQFAAKASVPATKLTPFYWATKGIAPKFTKRLEKHAGKVSERVVRATKKPGEAAVKFTENVEHIVTDPAAAAQSLVQMSTDIARELSLGAKEAAPAAILAAAAYYGGPEAAQKLTALYGKVTQPSLSPGAVADMQSQGGQGSLSNMPTDVLLTDPQVTGTAQQLMSQSYYDNYGVDMQSPEATDMISSNVQEASDSLATGKKSTTGAILGIGIPLTALLLR